MRYAVGEGKVEGYQQGENRKPDEGNWGKEVVRFGEDECGKGSEDEFGSGSDDGRGRVKEDRWGRVSLDGCGRGSGEESQSGRNPWAHAADVGAPELHFRCLQRRRTFQAGLPGQTGGKLLAPPLPFAPEKML